MNLVKWDLFRDMEDVSNLSNRLFGHNLALSKSAKEKDKSKAINVSVS